MQRIGGPDLDRGEAPGALWIPVAQLMPQSPDARASAPRIFSLNHHAIRQPLVPESFFSAPKSGWRDLQERLKLRFAQIVGTKEIAMVQSLKLWHGTVTLTVPFCAEFTNTSSCNPVPADGQFEAPRLDYGPPAMTEHSALNLPLEKTEGEKIHCADLTRPSMRTRDSLDLVGPKVSFCAG